MTKTSRLVWITAAVGGLLALAMSMVRTYYGTWSAVLTLGVIAGVTATIGEWRIYRRSCKREHLWGAIGSLILTLMLASYLSTL
jgi:uncharacterized membrane protein